MLLLGFGIGLVTGPQVIPKTAATDSIWAAIQASGKIKIGTDPTWPPYESMDNNSHVVGFEVDLANAIAAKLGLTIEWQIAAFPNIINLVQNKSIDLGASGVSITPERLNQVDFTIPHNIARRQVIMTQTKRDSMNLTTLTSLGQLKTIGLTVGAPVGTTEEQELTDAKIASKFFSDFEAAIQDLMSTNPTIDCVYAETPLPSDLISQYQAQGKPISVIYDAPYYPCAFAVNKDAHTFLTKVDAAIVEIIASGQMDALKAKWNI